MQYRLIFDDNFQLLAIYKQEVLVKVLLFCEDFENPYRIYLASLNKKVSGIGGQIFSSKLGSSRNVDLFLKSKKKVAADKKSYLSFRNQPSEAGKLAIFRLTPLLISKYHQLEYRDGSFEILENKKYNSADLNPSLITNDKQWLTDQVASFNQSGLIYSGLDIYQTALILANDHDELIVDNEESLFKLNKLAKMYWPNLTTCLSYDKINFKDIVVDIDSCLLRAWRFNNEIEAIIEETSIGLNIDLNLATNTASRGSSKHHSNFRIISNALQMLIDRVCTLNNNGRHLIDLPFIKGNDRKQLVEQLRSMPYQFGSISFTNSGILEIIIDNSGYPLALIAKQLTKFV